MREEYPVYIAERLGIDLGYKIYPEGDPDNLIDGFFLGYSSVMNAVEKEIGFKRAKVIFIHGEEKEDFWTSRVRNVNGVWIDIYEEYEFNIKGIRRQADSRASGGRQAADAPPLG